MKLLSRGDDLLIEGTTCEAEGFSHYRNAIS